jgi:hypothetical protein
LLFRGPPRARGEVSGPRLSAVCWVHFSFCPAEGLAKCLFTSAHTPRCGNGRTSRTPRGRGTNTKWQIGRRVDLVTRTCSMATAWRLNRRLLLPNPTRSSPTQGTRRRFRLFPKVASSPGILGGSSPPPSGHGCGRYSGGFRRPIPKRPLGNILPQSLLAATPPPCRSSDPPTAPIVPQPQPCRSQPRRRMT